MCQSRNFLRLSHGIIHDKLQYERDTLNFIILKKRCMKTSQNSKCTYYDGHTDPNVGDNAISF